jgi:hypothetical protein
LTDRARLKAGQPPPIDPEEEKSAAEISTLAVKGFPVLAALWYHKSD